jgi:hypothetical protein
MLCISLGSFTKGLKAMESLGTGKRFARLSKSTSCTSMTVFASNKIKPYIYNGFRFLGIL